MTGRCPATRTRAISILCGFLAGAGRAQDPPATASQRLAAFRVLAATPPVPYQAVREFVLGFGDVGGPSSSRPTAAEIREGFALARAALVEPSHREFAAYADWREGIALRNVSAIDAAIEAFALAAARWRESPPGHFARILIEWANSERHACRYDRALAALREYETAACPKDVWSDLEAMDARGRILLQLGLPDLAARVFEQERTIVAGFRFEAGGPDAESQAFAWWRAILHRISLGLVREDCDAVAATVAEAQGSPLIASQAMRDRAELFLHLGVAKAMRARGDPQRAPDGLAEFATCLAEPSLPEHVRAKAELWSARVLADGGRLAEARAHLARAAARLVRPRDSGPLREHVLLAAVAAQVAAEELAAAPTPACDLAPHLASLEMVLELWAKTPPRAGGFGLQLYEDERSLLSDLLRMQVLALGERDGCAAAVAWMLRIQALGSVTRTRVDRGYSLADVQRLLCAGDACVLAYQVGRVRSHVVCVDATSVAHAELGAPPALLRAGENLQLALAAAAASMDDGPDAARACKRAASVLGELVIPASWWPRLLRCRTLRIVGSDALGSPAVEFIPAPDGRRLGEAMAVTHLPSLPLGCALAEAAERDGPIRPVVHLVAAPAPPAAGALGAELPALRMHAADAEAVLAAYDPATRHVHLAGAAIKDAVRAAGSAGVLEVVVHTVEDRERPELQRGLLLAESPAGAVLWPDDLAPGAVPRLVVVAACAAGAGPVRRGDDGPSTLGGAFLRAGADVVVQPRVALEFAETVAALRAVNEELAAGACVAEALRRARVRQAARVAPVAALLQVVGWGDARLAVEPDRRQPQENGSTATLWIGGVVVVAVVLLLLGRCRRS